MMKAIRDSKEELTGHIDKKTDDIQQSLTKIEQSLLRLAEQVQEMEIRIEANEDNLTDARTRIGQMEKEIAFIKEKTDDLENRSRRSNVKKGDKDKVLRLARNKGAVYLDTNRVSFYPDYSIEVQRRMAEVKKKLREKNIEYASHDPAKPRIRHRERCKLFSTPSE
ncbi:hypothetical protein NFI96_028842, partial [Prochilodus magdalenae]